MGGLTGVGCSTTGSGSICPPRALSRKERLFVSGMSRGAVGGSNFVSCRIGRRRGSGSYC